MTAPVPLLDLTRQYRALGSELEEAVLRVLRSGRYILGEEVEAFEREVAEFVGSRHAVGLSSGTDALLVALMALGVGPGDTVIVPVYSFFATAGVVTRLGARPVFVDVAWPHLGMCPQGLQTALHSHPEAKAAIVVHLFGATADMPRLMTILEEAGVPLVEDAAQAIGTRGEGRGGVTAAAGTLGLCGCFSTFPSKNLGGVGDGGFLTTDDDEFNARVRSLRNHGQVGAYEHTMVGGNFRLDAMQAAALRVKLRHLAGFTEARRANAARYGELFASRDLLGWLTPPTDVADCHAYHQYVTHLPATVRDQVRESLVQQEVACAIYYPLPFHLQPCFAWLEHKPGDFRVAEEASARALALPIFPELTAEEQRRVVTALVNAGRESPS